VLVCKHGTRLSKRPLARAAVADTYTQYRSYLSLRPPAAAARHLCPAMMSLFLSQG